MGQSVFWGEKGSGDLFLGAYQQIDVVFVHSGVLLSH
jgi:hypothetical protein